MQALRSGWNKVVRALADRVSTGLQSGEGGRAAVERHDVFRALVLTTHQAGVSAGEAVRAHDGAVEIEGVGRGGEDEAAFVAAQPPGLLKEVVAKLVGRQVDALFEQVVAARGDMGVEADSAPREVVGSVVVESGGAPWTLTVKPSSVAHPAAGLGVFVERRGAGVIKAGTVLGFYPGIVYPPLDMRLMPNFPNVDADNDYLMARFDNTVLDAKGVFGAGISADEFALRLRKRRQMQQTGKSQLVHAAGAAQARVNPFALMHFVNHPAASTGLEPNVMWLGFDFMESMPGAHRAFIPNVYVRKQRTLMTTAGLGVIQQGMVMLATRDIDVDAAELFMDYRYNPSLDHPEWYEPVPGSMAAERWEQK
ncbi:uncharacterized protein AMSG_01327 [Thecamonas trahens ATCC 50062]|uniref:SET domain-containing protein n=1 Tax=Thecamonas trahens ATCC 50062 TaxID=461836 RepID=A0A0L0DMT7_THETB|nr:hypothetical protein AMSG_01327 [Thecamonas trahens ATCC 50062]KNC53617.1 hypothetical protein AMSG_01327 [Thecamonas trahens ATCC 50062]|eukprot:XP_013761934.1 hypothetical protein AMSG_01327 [Thecamonas trahens ATCC 50062]